MPVSSEQLIHARTVNPMHWLLSVFSDVRISRSGRHIRVENVLRADLKPEGVWISCDWYGGGIGDNISLVRTFSGCDFVSAVKALCGEPEYFPARIPPPVVIKTRPVPPRTCAPNRGRAYLKERGISPDTILEAEQSRVLDYVYNGVMFTGRDEHECPRLISLRFYNPLPPQPGYDKPLSKLDLEGSDKSYPVILRGDIPELAIVEGGVNMLAVRDMLSPFGCPSVMATGGVGVRGFMENKIIADIIRNSACILFFYENEMRDGVLCPDKQAKTDMLRYSMLQALTQISGESSIYIMRPPRFCKDAADWNLAVSAGKAQRPSAMDAEEYFSGYDPEVLPEDEHSQGLRQNDMQETYGRY